MLDISKMGPLVVTFPHGFLDAVEQAPHYERNPNEDYHPEGRCCDPAHISLQNQRPQTRQFNYTANGTSAGLYSPDAPKRAFQKSGPSSSRVYLIQRFLGRKSAEDFYSQGPH